jgi:exodeoxyribonuclease-5
LHPTLHLGFELASTDDLQLSAEQAAAVELLLSAIKNREEAALLGPAGSGKTTVLRALLRELDPAEVLVLAPTQKARRQVEVGLQLEGLRTTTVASVLRLAPTIDPCTGLVSFLRPAEADPMGASAMRQGPPPTALLVDESSMVGVEAGEGLAEVAEQLGAALVWVGDPAQLPPVGDGELCPRLISCPRTARLETVQRTGAGPVLQLSVALREAAHPAEVWPDASTANSASSVVLHPHPGAWIRSAHQLINSERWRTDPDVGRVVCWTHRGCEQVAAKLRSLCWGSAADQWHPGEWLLAPHGIPAEGAALANPRAAACAELQLVEIGTPQVLSHLLGTVDWLTPAKQLQRTIEIAAEATVCRCVVRDRLSGRELTVWLEPPGHQGDWARQVRQVRNAIRTHVHKHERRKLALKLAADLGTYCPTIRPAAVLTVHSSQGSTFENVWIWRDLSWAGLEMDVQQLAYVAVTRASRAVHVLPWGGAALPALAVPPAGVAAA